MCVSRIQRIMTSVALSMVLFFFLTNNVSLALGLQAFIIVMMLIWAITNFCPSIWLLKKIFPPCSWDK